MLFQDPILNLIDLQFLVNDLSLSTGELDMSNTATRVSSPSSTIQYLGFCQDEKGSGTVDLELIERRGPKSNSTRSPFLISKLFPNVRTPDKGVTEIRQLLDDFK